MIELENWLKANFITYVLTNENHIDIPEFGECILINCIDGKILDESNQLLITEEEIDTIEFNDIKYLIFEFGSFFFYTSINDFQAPKFNDLKYVGVPNLGTTDVPFVHLGVHGQYELMNGMHDYKTWCKKANFLKQEALGICEKNTLAGTLAFQIECQYAGIKPIIGETITIRGGQEYEIKVYATSETGWRNILNINKIINVDNFEDKHIKEDQLFERLFDVMVILGSSIKLSDKLIDDYKENSHYVFYQLDTVHYSSDSVDKEFLLNIKNYFDNFSNKIKPILLTDTYCLEKYLLKSRKTLHKIASVKFGYDSKNQYYKNLDEIYLELSPLFKDGESIGSYDSFEALLLDACNNTVLLSDQCDFTINTKDLKLPKYIPLTGQTSEEYFYELVEKGIEEKLSNKDLDPYIARISEEIDIIKEGGFVDYFLILADIFHYCQKEKIITGVGRGSVGGSELANVLGITYVDPLEGDLLFSRFLNKTRMVGSCPDIDFDVPKDKRDQIKKYMEDRFGYDNVCSIGSYTTLSIKAAIKDLAKLKGINIKLVNYFTGSIHYKGDWNWEDLFYYSQNQTNKSIKKFIQDNYQLFIELKNILDTPKAPSMHASGMIITPSFDKDGNPMKIYDWLPIKMMKGMLVCEWEGYYLDKAKYLKEDLLGLEQLDKFATILDIIKEKEGKEIDIYNLPLEDENIYHLFEGGHTEDVFQFNTSGFKGFCQSVKPDKFDDLVAMLALFRPGPMQINAHKDYALIKHGKKNPEYDWGTEEITENTYGLIIYQETIQKICSAIGGFSEAESDNIRRIMGKKLTNEVNDYRDKFIEGAIANGCEKDEATKIWNKMEGFAQYSFNKSHSFAYAKTAYISQWLKYYYPIAFWTTAFTYGDDKLIAGYISEMSKINPDLKVSSPNINYSIEKFYSDYEKKTIYWSIPQISYIGEGTCNAIIAERELNGHFYSFDEFRKRMPKNKVNKKHIINLILSGCFDTIENLTKIEDRKNLLKKFYKTINEEIPNEYLFFNEIDFVRLQKTITGLGVINYIELFSQVKNKCESHDKYIEAIHLLNDDNINRKCFVAGEIEEVVKRKSKNGDFCILKLSNNGDKLEVIIWNDTYTRYLRDLTEKQNKIVFVNGILKYDKYSGANKINSHQYSEIIFM